MPVEKWITFWVDPMYGYGLMDSPKAWRKFVESSLGGLKRLLKMKSNRMKSKYPDFGEGVKYTELPTLGKWAEENGLNLSIP